MAATSRAMPNSPSGKTGVSIKLVTKLLGAILTLSLIALAAYFYLKPRVSDADRGTALLVEAFSRRRLIEPRLSGGFKCGEFKPSSDDNSDINTPKLEHARSLIMDAVDGGSPSAKLAYARLLLLSKPDKLTDGLQYLRQVLTASPESAEARNDLGVCLVQQGNFEDALDEFDAALKLKPDMPEALFNHALCYERLLLRDAASDEYSRLLRIEIDEGWIAEIARRQKEMSVELAPQKAKAEIVVPFDAAFAAGNLAEANRIAEQNIEVINQHAYKTALEYLTQAVAGNRDEAARALRKIELIGTRFAELEGDTSTSDLAAYYRSLPATEEKTELTLMTDVRTAEKLVFAQKYSVAQPSFEQLLGRFAERKNEVLLASSIQYIGLCEYGLNHLTSSIEFTRQSLAMSEKHKWPHTRAAAWSHLGLVYSRLGQESVGIRYCEQALRTYENTPISRAYVQNHLSEAYGNLGDLDKALACLRDSTRLYLSSVPSLKEIASNYLSIADFYRRRGDHSLALLYSGQSLSLADRAGDNNRAAQASSYQAVEYARLQQHDRAEEALVRAFDHLRKTERGQQTFTEPLVLKQSGDTALQFGESSRAIEQYSKAERLLRKAEDKTIPLIVALGARAEAYTGAREFNKARADLDRAVALIEGQRGGILDRKDRSSFLDASQGVFDQLILLNAGALGDYSKAFNSSEQARARTLLDDFGSQRNTGATKNSHPIQRADVSSLSGGKEVKPLTLPEVQRALPADLRLLTYSVTNQRTYLFLITSSGLEVAESPANIETLDPLVGEYISGVKNKTSLDEVTEKARKLYEYLIEPVERQLGDGKQLCIVPDKALHFLPFAALVDRKGRYLVESLSLTYAPSASALVRCIEESRRTVTTGVERILAVGNPDFDRDALPTLPDLPEAEREAHESAAFYGAENAVVLTGASATKVRLQAGLENCNVAHLAVHCLIGEKSPSLAALVLAGRAASAGSDQKPSPDEGLLYLNEVYAMRLPQARLVVLSACQSGLGQYYRGEGIVSLIRPFLALRVPTVVASLWSVDSKATAELMIDFHRVRKSANGGAGESLRAAQIKMLEGKLYEHPYYWAPFVPVGSSN